MDNEKLIEQLKKSADFEDYPVVASFAAIIEKKYLREAATALSTLQAEAEGMRSNWYKSVEEIQKLRAENIRWGQVASEQDKQLDRLLAELGQVKHQRDSYRMYHDDLASKPNCNTCADKDCKYRPIPGDTVRANCPLWRGPEEEG